MGAVGAGKVRIGWFAYAVVCGVLPFAADRASAACVTVKQDTVCTGTVNGATNGVSASATSGDVSVTVKSGSVAGPLNGVAATNTGYDSVYVVVNGAATGKTGAGIATVTNGYSQIDISSGATVTGATGIGITSNGGYGILNNAGTVLGTAGPGIALDLGVGTESINNNGSITGATGSAMKVIGGTVTLNNNALGTLDGAVLGNDATAVNNFGLWTNAAGSTFGTLVSSGSLALGKPNATTAGVFTVTGDAAFKTTSSTTLNIFGNGANDKIVVGGDLSIEGGTLALHGVGTGFARGTQYTLISAAGTVTGAFTSITADIPKYLPILVQTGGDLAVGLYQYDFRELAVTRNQYASAGMIAQAATYPLTAAGTAIIQRLNTATDAQVQAGLTQIAGDGLTAAKSVALRQGSMFMETIAEQQAFWRSRETVDPNGITVYPLAYASAATGPGWYAGQIKPLPPRLPPPPIDRSIRMWVSGFGGTQSTKGDVVDGSTAQSAKVGGGAIGVDVQLGRNILLGVAGGYSIGSFAASERQTNGQNTGLHVAMYTGFTANGFYGSANIGYANFATTTKRTVAVAGFAAEQESGSYNSNELRVRMEAGKLIDLGIGSVTAFTALQAASLTSHTYVETSVSSAGAGVLGLALPRQTTNSVPAEIGFRAETRLRMGMATLAPWVQVSLVHDFARARENVEMLAALPGTAQRVYGASDARDTLRLKGGAQLTFSTRAAVFVSAEADLSTKQRVVVGKGGFRYGW